VREAEVNPMIVMGEGQGVVMADAVVIVGEGAAAAGR
jgi:succinyl-CoA synthetase beta subunit